jgi:hypothetical protein
MRLKPTEERHIKSLGDKWSRALAAASMSIRTDSKLVGLDKIRQPLAIVAALKATGAADREGFVIPKSAGPPHYGIQEVVDAAFHAAVAAAQKVLA